MKLLETVPLLYCILRCCVYSLISNEDLEYKLKNTSPLILTSYILSGNTADARKVAEVKYDKLNGVKSYAGYFTVSKEFNSNMFFWFFPSESNYENAPVVLWLQGGPGSSSLIGALAINGAFEVTDDIKLKKKEHYWSQTHSVIYIDNPVGTGFSFTDEGGYTHNETIIGEHLYLALLEFFQIFPELKENDFFVTGESYAGKYVPAIAHYIMKQNPKAQQKINLKGLAIGNPHCDPVNQLGYAELMYQLGLIDLNGKKLVQIKVDEIIELIHKQEWREAYDSLNKFIAGNSGESTLFQNLTGFTNYYNILDINDTATNNMRKYVDIPEFREALHVGNVTFDDGEKVLAAMITDFMQSITPLLIELLDHYKILFYNGQFDILIAYPLMMNFLQKMEFKDSEAYKVAERHIWMIDGDVAGYVKEAGNVMDVLVRKAGHMVPMDQSKWALDMLTRADINEDEREATTIQLPNKKKNKADSNTMPKLSSMKLFKAVLTYYCYILPICDCLLISDEDVENELKNTPPLILTPYLEIGNIEEARKLSEVKYDKIENIKSYAGYFTVNKEFNSNMFFWFFPSEVDYKNAPVVLWLQGGPGASSLMGALVINGAYEVTDDLKLKKRSYYWSQTHSVIYIDNPVGSGFSFSDEAGYTRNQTTIGKHLYLALLQFFQLFPELKENDFFVSGESYAGKYVPTISHYIMKQNPTAQQKINLKGLAIGNGRCDPENQLEYADLLYQLGLIDLHGKKIVQDEVNEIIDLIHKELWEEAYTTMNWFINGNTGELTLIKNLTGFTNYYNILDINDTYTDNMRKYVDIPKFRAALHVGNVTYDDGDKVFEALIPDIMQSIAPLLTELLDQHKVLFYNGQLDIVLAPTVQLHFLQKLKFKDSEAYKSAERHIWRIDGDIAGYVKEAGNIMEIMIRNSGHMVPMHQPKWALDMLTRFTRNQSFY
ncbi:hypothetical protein FQR65_LT14307 [Abscondita terminalis]|nr:hypothetical protein FQR65_LT14307 [Abscondita terminalis]